MDWMFVSSQKSYVEILTPHNVVVLGGEILEVTRYWGWSPPWWSCALIKETLESCFALSAIWGNSEQIVVYEPQSRSTSGRIHFP